MTRVVRINRTWSMKNIWIICTTCYAAWSVHRRRSHAVSTDCWLGRQALRKLFAILTMFCTNFSRTKLIMPTISDLFVSLSLSRQLLRPTAIISWTDYFLKTFISCSLLVRVAFCQPCLLKKWWWWWWIFMSGSWLHGACRVRCTTWQPATVMTKRSSTRRRCYSDCRATTTTTTMSSPSAPTRFTASRRPTVEPSAVFTCITLGTPQQRWQWVSGSRVKWVNKSKWVKWVTVRYSWPVDPWPS